MLDGFWSASFWLPEKVSWDDLDSFEADGNQISRAKDLLIVPLYAAVLLVARFMFEITIGNWTAAFLNIKDTKKIIPEKNEMLESEFRKCKHPSDVKIKQISFDLGKNKWNERKIQHWFRHKRNLNKLPAVRKFRETLWRLFFYATVYTYGSITLSRSPWFWNHTACWANFPMQVMPESTYVYYMAELSFYLSLAITLLIDNKRKDFPEQIVHHIATISLIALSYACNFTRVGTLVMWCHDISDIFLESAKVCVYAKYNVAKDILFALFGLIFFISRLIYFPFWILDTTWRRSMVDFDPFPGYYLFNGLLFVLQVLHIIWFGMIMKKVWSLTSGGQLDDSRSSEEELDSDHEKED